MSAQIIRTDLAVFSRPHFAPPTNDGAANAVHADASPNGLWAFFHRRRAVLEEFLALPDDSAGTLERWMRARCEHVAGLAAHVRRVADLAVEVAGELRLPGDTVRCLERAGLLHDIGLLCVPGVLSPRTAGAAGEPAELVRRHPEVAFELLSQRPGCEDVAEIVLSLRERVDGTGGPRGLAGSRIPLGARILSVADALDSSVAPWAWGESGSLVQAVTTIVLGAGTAFDPDVVAACIRVLDGGEGPVQ